MAVEDKYVDSDTEAGKLTAAAFVHADAGSYAVAIVEVAAADDNASIYRLFKNVPADLIPAKIEIACDAITAGTDWDLGLYESSVDGVDGIVIDADKLADGLDLSSAIAFAAALDGLEALDVDEAQKTIYELGGQTLDTKKISYDIALTANVVGSAAGTITVKAWFVQG